MRIRRMMEADAPQVAAIEQQSFSRPWSEKSFAEAAKDANAVFLVAEEQDASDSRIVGYIGMYLSPPEGEISNVAVERESRGCGYGKALVRAMEEQAAACGVECIFLEVRHSNDAAIHVYTELGFAEIGVRRGFYDFPKEDARIMRWQNNPAEGGSY